MDIKVKLIRFFQCCLLFIWINRRVMVLGLREPPTVQIPGQGTLMGFYMNMFRTQRIIAYLGIPYAHPPIYEKRFTPPVIDKLPAWDGIRNATTLAKGCWSDNRKPSKKHEQALMKLLGVQMETGEDKYSEDCLYLNIYIPEDPPPMEGYAIIVWLHSGDFLKGNASELSPFQLVFKQKVIVVTVSYRMGIFGFFTSLDGEAPGNFGLMDQSAALIWINQNIKLFGGNDKSVTLMGHGAGGVSASLHLTSGEWSADLFDRAIIMSGTGFSFLAVRSPLSYAGAVDSVASAFGCYRKPTSDLMGCLRRVDAQIIMEGSPVVDWGPIIDDGLSNITTPFIPDDPRFLIERSDARRIPLLVGFTNMEDSLDVSLSDMLDDGISNEAYESLVGNSILNELSQIEINDTCNSISTATMDALNFVYKPYPPTNDPMLLRNKWIEFCVERSFVSPSILLANSNSPHAKTYVYRFDIKPKTMAAIDTLPSWSGVPHGFDLVFLWGFPYWVPLENQTQWDNADKRVSDIIMTLWANYAKFSDPTKFGVYIKWDPFTIDKQGILIIDRSFNMSDANTINYQAVQFWNDYYPKVINFASQCCNVTNGESSRFTPTTRTMWIFNIFSISLTPIFHSLLHRINFLSFPPSV